MIGDILQPTHLLFVLVVALLVLGPKRLPEAGRALGKGLRDFRMAISGDEDHSGTTPIETATAPAPEVVVPPATAPPVDSAPAPVDIVEPAEAHAQASEQPAETVHSGG